MPAAGIAAAAQAADYKGYLGRFFSKAAFVKAGRWMVKVRVSGPQARAGEVNEITAALLDGLRFEGEDKPKPANPIAAAECGTAAAEAARLLPNDNSALEGALLGTFDAAGLVADNAKPNDKKLLLPRIGSHWCRSSLSVGEARFTILRATGADSSATGVGAKSVLLLLHRDSGGIFEVVRLEERKYLLLDHMIAEMSGAWHL